jgi:D-sedoheptulose 7-phosphate isomerase
MMKGLKSHISADKQNVMAMVRDFSQNYLSELTGAINHLPLERFAEIVDSISIAYERNQQIFTFGNGGSSSTASHFACDLNKGASLDLEKRFKVICLNDNLPTMLAYANDKSYEDIFVEQLKNFLKPDDIVLGISGSGNSRNVVKAIQYANENNAKSIALTGFDGGELAKIAKVSIVVPANDIQKVEDIHLILVHMVMQVLYYKLREQPVFRAIHETKQKQKRRYDRDLVARRRLGHE